MTKITYKQRKDDDFTMRTAKAAPMEKYEKLLATVKLLSKTRYDLWFHVDISDDKVQPINIHDECKKVLMEIGEYE